MTVTITLPPEKDDNRIQTWWAVLTPSRTQPEQLVVRHLEKYEDDARISAKMYDGGVVRRMHIHFPLPPAGWTDVEV